MPMQAAGASNRPISHQPFGRWSLRAVCGVAGLPIAELLAAHRALHPIPQRPQRDPCGAVNRLRKTAVKLTFLKGAALPDPAPLFNASLDGNARRAIDIHEGDTLPADAFRALIRAAVELNALSGSKAHKGRAPGHTGSAA